MRDSRTAVSRFLKYYIEETVLYEKKCKKVISILTAAFCLLAASLEGGLQGSLPDLDLQVTFFYLIKII